MGRFCLGRKLCLCRSFRCYAISIIIAGSWREGRSYKVKKYVVSTFCRGRGVAVAIPILLATSQIR